MINNNAASGPGCAWIRLSELETDEVGAQTSHFESYYATCNRSSKKQTLLSALKQRSE